MALFERVSIMLLLTRINGLMRNSDLPLESIDTPIQSLFLSMWLLSIISKMYTVCQTSETERGL